MRSIFLALAAPSMVTAPAFAETIVSPAVGSPVTATAVVNLSIGGSSNQDICQFSLSGSVVDGNTVSFSGGDFDIVGNEYCSRQYYFSDFPVMVKTIPGDIGNVMISGLNFFSSTIPCFKNNFLFYWSNATSKATSGLQIYATCQLNSASLAISPIVTIAP